MIETIQDEIERISKAKHLGTICKCCGTPAIVYKRTVTKGMAKILLAMYHMDNLNSIPYHINDIANALGRNIGGGDLAKLNYWGLITQIKERSGEWYISKGGKEFIEGNCSISKYAEVYKKEVIRFTGDFVLFKDILK